MRLPLLFLTPRWGGVTLVNLALELGVKFAGDLLEAHPWSSENARQDITQPTTNSCGNTWICKTELRGNGMIRDN